MYSYYGTLADANEYFDNRLHEEAWYDAIASDRPKALIKATQIIDNLNFKGYKASVYDILYDEDGNELDVTDEEIREAEAEQELEFPRGEDVDVPDPILIACWEIAHALLDGVDPDLDVENLGVVSQGYASVRTTYARSQAQVEHLMHGIPSATAWRYLKPFLRDADEVKLSRVN
jgi:hypothetical protein